MMPEDPTRILVETIQKLQRRGHLRNLRNILDKSHPTDIAIVLRHIPEPTEQLKLFNEVEDLDKRAEILSELSPILLPSFLEVISDEALVPLLEAMAGDDTADILEFLPEERKATLLRQMSREEMTEAQDLLQYDPETAGGIMVPNFFALSEELTCDLAIQALRDVHDELEMVFYAYVTNAHGHLVGVLSLREVVTAPPDTPLRDVMETEVTRVRTSDDQETVARLVARYNLLALPVVDDNNVLAGIVTVDDVIDVIREEATEDMFRMAGAGDTPFGFDAQSIFASTRSRLPWLFASWIGGVLAGVIIQGYEERLLQVAALAAFIPVIIGMAGNVGTQSLTVVTRGLALGQIDARQVLKVVGRELSVGILCGVIYGALLGLAGAALISLQGGQVDPWRFGLSVGLALCSGMLIAAVVGGAVPMLLHRLSIDPAVATGPFVTTSVDILGVLVYFNFATILLGL